MVVLIVEGRQSWSRIQYSSGPVLRPEREGIGRREVGHRLAASPNLIESIINGEYLFLADTEVPFGDGDGRVPEDIAKKEKRLFALAFITFLEPDTPAEGLTESMGGEHLCGLYAIANLHGFKHLVNGLSGERRFLSAGDEHVSVNGWAAHFLPAVRGETL